MSGGGLEGEGCQCRQVSGCHRSYQCHGIPITIRPSWHDLAQAAQSSSPVHGCLLFSMQIKFVLLRLCFLIGHSCAQFSERAS